MTSAGSPSATVIGPTVADGPRLDTCRVQTTFAPAVAEPVCDLASARSEIEENELVSVSELLTRFGSKVGDVTVAVLTNAPVPASAATFTTMPTEVVAPSASEPVSVQVTSCPAAEHAHAPAGATVEA